MTAKKPPKQTLTGLIRSRVATYQARQLAGELQKTFAQELTDEGHPISYSDFRALYSRARIQLKVNDPQIKQPKTEKPKERIEPKNEKTEVEENDTSHRPADLDAIIHQTPNLADLAKLAKLHRRNQK